MLPIYYSACCKLDGSNCPDNIVLNVWARLDINEEDGRNAKCYTVLRRKDMQVFIMKAVFFVKYMCKNSDWHQIVAGDFETCWIHICRYACGGMLESHRHINSNTDIDNVYLGWTLFTVWMCLLIIVTWDPFQSTSEGGDGIYSHNLCLFAGRKTSAELVGLPLGDSQGNLYRFTITTQTYYKIELMKL